MGSVGRAEYLQRVFAVWLLCANGCSEGTDTHGAGAAPNPIESAGASAVPLLKLPDGFTLGGDCPDPGPAAEAEASAQAAATIPLKKGLTLSSIWIGKGGDYDHECLTQIGAVDARSVSLTYSCPVGDEHENVTYHRTLCRTDLRDAYMYHTGFLSKHLPDVLGGTTTFSFSEKSFAKLKGEGEMPHRYVQLEFSPKKNSLFVRDDQVGTLKRKDTSERSPYRVDLFDTLDVIVNDRIVALPVINAWGNAAADGGTGSMDEVRSIVLDDAHFPIVLQYEQVGWHFSIKVHADFLSDRRRS